MQNKPVKIFSPTHKHNNTIELLDWCTHSLSCVSRCTNWILPVNPFWTWNALWLQAHSIEELAFECFLLVCLCVFSYHFCFAWIFGLFYFCKTLEIECTMQTTAYPCKSTHFPTDSSKNVQFFPSFQSFHQGYHAKHRDGVSSCN